MYHFNIRIVREGDKYGREDCLTNSGATLVEFYDARFPHTPHGQFVSRYYAATLLATKDGDGLCLDGGIPEWSVSASQMDAVRTTLRDMKGRKAL